MLLNRKILEKIEEKNGESFYLLDSYKFEQNFNKVVDEYRKYYPKTNIAYSYKTNYTPRFGQIVNDKGGYAEVVSGMEMYIAKKIGVPYDKIFFNGPFKELEYVEELLLNNGVVNVDSLEELKKIEKISKKNTGKILKIGLRLNFDIKDEVISRFGFDTQTRDFKDALNLIKNSNLKLVSLHCHFATRYLYSWKNRTQGMLDVIDKYFLDELDKIEFISLGGGLYGEMPEDMKKQFPQQIPSFNEYAEVSAKVFAKYFKEKTNEPTLIIEPGTALVANAMKYVTKIVSIKEVRDRTIVTLFGSTYNINPSANRKKMPLKIYSKDELQQKNYKNVYFGGYTCIESDYLYREYEGALLVGDYIVFDEVGSYSVVMKPPFIMPQVAVVEPIDNNNYKVIKRREKFEDIFQTYGMLS
jgi:diaminopimelate decarboxylase